MSDLRPTPETDASIAGSKWAVDADFARNLERERDEAREELADIRQRLKGHADSKLDGENGLASATMRGFDQLQAENEAMREAVREAEALLVAVDNGAQQDVGGVNWYDRRKLALLQLQPFINP